MSIYYMLDFCVRFFTGNYFGFFFFINLRGRYKDPHFTEVDVKIKRGQVAPHRHAASQGI